MAISDPVGKLIERAFSLHRERLIHARSEEIARTRAEQASRGYIGKDSNQGVGLGRRVTERILANTKQLIGDLDRLLAATGASASAECLATTRQRFTNLVASMAKLPVLSAEEYLGKEDSISQMVAPRISMLWPAARMELDQEFEMMILKHSSTAPPANMRQLKINSQIRPVHFEDFSGHDFERLVVAFCIQRGWSNVEWIGQLGQDGGRDVAATDESGRKIILLCANYKKLDFRKAGGDLGKLGKGEYPLPDHTIVVAGGALTASLRGDIKAKALELGLASHEVWSGVELEELIRKHAPYVLPRFCGGEPFPESIDEVKEWAAIRIVAAGSNSKAAPSFSKEALHLLRAMAAADDGSAFRSESHDGYSLTVGDVDFVSAPKLRREMAKWESVLNELLNAGFATEKNNNFELTDIAYKFVDSLPA